jgi:hypothetical protein
MLVFVVIILPLIFAVTLAAIILSTALLGR